MAIRPNGIRDSNRAYAKKLALYGLKQAPRLWHQTVGSFLLSIGIHRPLADESLYTLGVLILLYVNDLVVLYTDAASEKAMSIRRP